VTALLYLRETEEQAMLVALNFFGHDTLAPLPAGQWQRRLSTHLGGLISAGTLILAPFEATILELNKV